jgi:DNA-binding CsgD family transcriptional regulator
LNNTNVRTGDAPVGLQRPSVERRQADRRQTDRRRDARPDTLPELAARECTGRERQIVRLVVQGMTNKEIAQTLGIAEDTVKKHLLLVYRKLGVRRRALLIVDNAAAMRLRLPTTPVE